MRVVPGLAVILTLACTDTEGGDVAFAFDDVELETMAAIDDVRADQSLSGLAPDPLLGELARAHAQAMLDGEVPFGHDGFGDRAEAMSDEGYIGAAENVAVNSGFDDPVTVAVEGWVESEGHYANIVGDYTHTGVGVASDGEQVYFTQLFGVR